MSDFNKPTNTELYTDIWTIVRAMFAALGKWDYTGISNLPSGLRRFNSSTGGLEQWNGSAWTELNGWADWSPTYGANGSMTYTGVSTTYAKWRRFGKVADFALLASGTTGGSANTTLTFTLPATAASTSPHYLAYLGTAPVVSGIASHNSTTVMNVRRADNANLALSANFFLICSGRLHLA